MPPPPYDIIDVSGHYGATPHTAHTPSLADLDRRAKHLGIGRTFVVDLVGVYHDFVAANRAVRMATRMFNSLTPAATLDPRRPTHAALEIQRCSATETKLYRFFPNEQGGWSPRDPAFRHLAELIGQQDGTLMVEVGSQSGFITDVVSSLHGIDIKLILGNVGYANSSEAIALMAANPSVHVESRRLCTPDSLEVYAAAVGSDRILFGTGGPPFNAQAVLNLVLQSNLPDSDKKLILAGNAKRLILGEAAGNTPTRGLTPNPFGLPVRGSVLGRGFHPVRPKRQALTTFVRSWPNTTLKRLSSRPPLRYWLISDQVIGCRSRLRGAQRMYSYM